MKKSRFLSYLIAVFALIAFTLAIAPAAQAAYPEPDKVIEFLHHSSPGGGASRAWHSSSSASGSLAANITLMRLCFGASAALRKALARAEASLKLSNSSSFCNWPKGPMR